MQYFIKRGEKVQGPFSREQLLGFAKAKKITVADLVSNSAQGPFQELKSVWESIKNPPAAPAIPEPVTQTTEPVPATPPVPMPVVQERFETPVIETGGSPTAQPEPQSVPSSLPMSAKPNGRKKLLLIGGIGGAAVGALGGAAFGPTVMIAGGVGGALLGGGIGSLLFGGGKEEDGAVEHTARFFGVFVPFQLKSLFGFGRPKGENLQTKHVAVRAASGLLAFILVVTVIMLLMPSRHDRHDELYREGESYQRRGQDDLALTVYENIRRSKPSYVCPKNSYHGAKSIDEIIAGVKWSMDAEALSNEFKSIKESNERALRDFENTERRLGL
jgi:hypothetical protein